MIYAANNPAIAGWNNKIIEANVLSIDNDNTHPHPLFFTDCRSRAIPIPQMDWIRIQNAIK